AFGAHGLKSTLVKHGTSEVWDTACFYHMVHALGLLCLSWSRSFRLGPAVCFLVGILVFSGSLYVLSVTGIRWLGAITPIGGVALLLGWAWIAKSCTREERA
ncbi:MAG: DUF423 domain-containing protein, partial [Verrucomicrobia bacterium]|nr:DUF423 domain-containing protein [Verrucomicrobiota bacterium]